MESNLFKMKGYYKDVVCLAKSYLADLDRNHFNYLVRKYAGDKYVKHFTC